MAEVDLVAEAYRGNKIRQVILDFPEASAGPIRRRSPYLLHRTQ